MSVLTPGNLLEQLNWRYAVKTFDANRKLSAEQFDALLESLRLAASSFGLQPWKFVVVDDPALRAQVREHSWGQSQTTDASQLIVLCAQRELTADDITRWSAQLTKTRGGDPATHEGYRKMMLGWHKSKTPEQLRDWMARQVYLALGTLLTAAAALGIDACPMEGFDPAKVDEVLGLEKLGLHAVVMCPVGFRSSADKYAGVTKVRYPQDEVIVRM
jgi:nitroreductase